MKVYRVCVAVALALSLGSRAALPQATEADERVDRIVGMAMARGGAHSFLQRLTDSIGPRVTGSTESRATADLLLRTLREAGFEDAHFEEYALESRWQRGRAAGLARVLLLRHRGPQAEARKAADELCAAFQKHKPRTPSWLARVFETCILSEGVGKAREDPRFEAAIRAMPGLGAELVRFTEREAPELTEEMKAAVQRPGFADRK